MTQQKHVKPQLKIIASLLFLLVCGWVAARVLAQGGTGQIKITLPGLIPGQTVAGQLDLAPQIEPPSPLVRVEYYLDEQPLAITEQPPYTFRWDTAATPAGVHILTVKAIDQVGNTGQYQVGLLVLAPLTFKIPPPARQEVALGQEVTLQIPTEPETRVKQVEVFLDDRLIAREARPAYHFKFDSSAYTPGEYTLMIQVEDEAGQTVNTRYPLVFTDPTAAMSWPERLKALWWDWWDWIKRGLAIFLIVVVLALLVGTTGAVGLAALRRWQEGRHRVQGYLTIKNRGNIPSRYEIQVSDPVGALTFQLGLNGIYLQSGALPAHPVPVAVPAQAVPQATAAVPAMAVSTRPTPQAASPGPIMPSPELPAPVSESLTQAAPPDLTGQIEGASRTFQETAGIARLVVGMINLVASVLPPFLGQPLRALSRLLYRPLMLLNRLFMLPLRLIRMGRQISNKKAKLSQPNQPSASAPATATASKPVLMSPQVAIPQPALAAHPGNGTSLKPSPSLYPELVGVSSQAVTPFLEPGENFSLDLLVKPVDPRRTEEYTFTVTTRSLAHPEARARSEQQRVKIRGSSPVSWVLPFLATLLTVALISIFLIIAVVLIASLIFWL